MKTIRLLDNDAIPDGPIVPRDVLATLVRASTIIEDAEEWAKQQHLSLAAELEEQRRHAHAAAFAEWIAKHADVQSRYAAKVDALEKQVLDLVQTCLSRILTALPRDEVLHGLVAPVLADLKSSGEVVIMVHPEELLAARKVAAVLEPGLPANVSLVARADATLGPNDCLVYTDVEVFNVSIPVTSALFCRALADVMESAVPDVD